MKNYPLTENDVKKLLNIDTWRNMSKDKIIQFVSNLDRMDPEVAKKAIEQFPNFSRLVLDALKEYKTSMETAIKENTALNQQFISLCNHAIDVVKELGNGSSVSWEQKRECFEEIHELVKMAADATTKTKEANSNHVNIFGVVIAFMFGAVLTLLGVSSTFRVSGKRV